MLSDREVEEIERGRRERVGGPIVHKWVDLLLADRRERLAQLDYMRKRLDQAFRYLDGLLRDIQHPRPKIFARPGQPACPRCGEPYERASGVTPNGIVYAHSNGTECRT